MKIPKELQRVKRVMTPDMIELGKRLFLEGNSERYVAKALGVSRHTAKIHCKKGFREWYYKRYKIWDYIKAHEPGLWKNRRISAFLSHKVK